MVITRQSRKTAAFSVVIIAVCQATLYKKICVSIFRWHLYYTIVLKPDNEIITLYHTMGKICSESNILGTFEITRSVICISSQCLHCDTPLQYWFLSTVFMYAYFQQISEKCICS